MSQYYNQVSYGLTQPLITEAPTPIIALRAPTIHDIKWDLGQLWIQPKNTSNVPENLAWVLTSIVNNTANWLSIAGGGTAGTFTTLTVTTGPSTFAGSMTVAGNITSTTGNILASSGTVTAGTNLVAEAGSVTAGTSITADLGNITATDGNVVLSTAGTYISLPGPVFIYSGAGAPASGLALHVGDMYINTTAASATTRAYMATAVGTWTNFTMAA